MYHIVVIGLAAVLVFLWWNLIQSSPRVLSMIMPPKLTYGVGLVFFVLAMFLAFADAYVLKDAGLMLESFVMVYAGLWLMLASSSGARGSYGDEQMLRRVFLMMGLLTLVTICFLYVRSAQMVAVLNLVLVTAGFCVATEYMRHLDRGR